MICRWLNIAQLIWLIAIFLAGVGARQSYVDLIPNGANVYRNGVYWSAIGHSDAAGSQGRINFGSEFATAGYQWTSDFCHADSDGDGFSNGAELGDNDCIWTMGATPSRTTDITHPGFADSKPSTPATTNPTTSSPPPATSAPPPSTLPPIPAALTVSPTFTIFTGLALSWNASRTDTAFTFQFDAGRYGSLAVSPSGMVGNYIFASYRSGTPACTLYTGDNYNCYRMSDQSGIVLVGGSVVGSAVTVSCRVQRSTIGIASGVQRMIFATGRWVGAPLQHNSNTLASAKVNIDTGMLETSKTSFFVIGWIVMGSLFGVWIIVGIVCSRNYLSVMVTRIVTVAAFLSILAAFLVVFAMYLKDLREEGKAADLYRACGWAACAGFVMVLIPTGKHVALSAVFASSYERTIWVHPLIGFLLFIFSTIHMGGMINNGGFSKEGCASWCLMAIMVITGSVRQYFFTLFRYTHFVFVAAIITAGLHVGPVFALMLIPGCLLWLLDIAFRMWNAYHSKRRLLTMRSVVGGSVTEIKLVLSWTDPPAPAQHCFLAIETGIMHPFSIASYEADTRIATFYCRTTGGSFTRRLATLAAEFTSDKAGCGVMCLGPYGSPQFNIHSVGALLLVAGGIGITSIMYVLQWLSLNKPPSVAAVTLVWAVREEDLVCLIEPQLAVWAAALRNASVDVVLNVLCTSRVSPTAAMSFCQKRPSLKEIGELTQKSSERTGRTVGLFCCGPESMMNDCAEMATEHRFLLHRETFSF